MYTVRLLCHYKLDNIERYFKYLDFIEMCHDMQYKNQIFPICNKFKKINLYYKTITGYPIY